MCVKRKRTHPRIAVGAISESRRIGGNRSVGNRKGSLSQDLLSRALSACLISLFSRLIPPTEAVACVKREFARPRITVGAISESRHSEIYPTSITVQSLA